MTEPRSNLPRRGEMSPSLGPPSDGFDYLLQVRWESRRCEQTKAVDVPKEHEAAAPTQQLREQPLFDLRLPAFVDLSPEWIEHFLGSFQRLRQVMEGTMNERRVCCIRLRRLFQRHRNRIYSALIIFTGCRRGNALRYRRTTILSRGKRSSLMRCRSPR